MKNIRIFKSLLLVSACCLLLTACGKEQEGSEQPDDTSPAPTAESSFSQKMEEGGQVGETHPLTGKAFGTLPVVGKEDAVYCNLPENVRSWENIIPMCVDPVYGILYYVDYGGDYNIHAVYNGESQTVLELPGKRLFCRGGKLYFLLESYNQFRFEGAKSGNIAEYDPVTGEVKVLTDKTFTSIVVYQDLIYGKCQDREEEYVEGHDEEVHTDDNSFWFYFFDTKELVERKKTGGEYVMDFRRYGEYFLAAALEVYKEDPRYNIQTGTELRKWNGERGTVWDGLIFMPSGQHYIKGENFYWIDFDGFHIWNSVSGEEKLYPLEFENSGQYILVGDWLLSTKYQLVDMQKGELEKWSSADEKLKLLHELYTDGERIYAIAGLFGGAVDQGSVFRQVQVTQGENGYELQFEAISE